MGQLIPGTIGLTLAEEIELHEKTNMKLFGRKTNFACSAKIEMGHYKVQYEKALARYNDNPNDWINKHEMERCKKAYENAKYDYENYP